MTWATGRLCAYDLESTGINVETARIVTANLTLTGADQADETCDLLVDPGIDIPAEATAVHGITTEHARAEGIPPADAVRIIADLIYGAWADGIPLVGYNVCYDLTVLDREHRRHLGQPFRVTGPVIDPYVIDKQVDKYRKGSRKLVDVAKHYGVPLADAHNATADALAAVGVLRALAAKYPELRRMDLRELYTAQAQWRREWAAGFREHLRKTGKPADDVTDAWPMQPWTGPAGTDIAAAIPESSARDEEVDLGDEYAVAEAQSNEPTTEIEPAKKRTRKTKAAPAGVDRIPKRSQGYYRDPTTGEKYKSVTTALKQGVPKDALVYWSANITAETALEYLPRLVREARRGPDDIYDWLRKEHIRRKDDRADVGTAVHSLIEAHILGQPVPADLLDDANLAPYLENFLRFVNDFGVEFTASEMVVANPTDGWAGTLDWMATLRTRPDLGHLMGDTKTGGEIGTEDDEIKTKGVYPEAGLQMAAYRHATKGWTKAGEVVDMPDTDGGVVLHLRPEGYRLVPVRCDDEVYSYFLPILTTARWTSDVSKTVVGAALQPTMPTTSEEAA